MEVTRTVRPTIASRQLYITRSSAYGPSQSSSRAVERSSRSSYGGSSGALALMTKQGEGGFGDVKSTRDKEKREMQVNIIEQFSSLQQRLVCGPTLAVAGGQSLQGAHTGLQTTKSNFARLQKGKSMRRMYNLERVASSLLSR